jgi:SAM-dependent methyltransferase
MATSTLPDQGCAFEMRITDPAMQAYLQRYPFASGPDDAMNQAARAAIVENLKAREPGFPAEVTLLDHEQAELPPGEMQRAQAMLADLKLPAERVETVRHDFAWEANLVPRNARRVLVIGCGDGMELIFLRAVLPQAQIVAIDYYDNLKGDLKQRVGVEFFGGDMQMHLRALTTKFDLIFSNHTLEHLYIPDETIETLFGLLAPGGTLVSVLPMDGKETSPFREKISQVAQERTLAPADMVYIDAGHPWKTNPGDLKRTLSKVGFGEITFYQRGSHLSRFRAMDQAQLARGHKRARLLQAVIFGPAHAVARTLFPRQAPAGLLKLLYAAERRVPFGPNTLKNAYTEEVLLKAVRTA